MKKVKCLVRKCEKKPSYCSEHYAEVEMERERVIDGNKKRKKTIRKVISSIAMVVCLILFATFVTEIIMMDFVDESDFCHKKMQIYFPEYDFIQDPKSVTVNAIRSVYVGNHLCKGYYREGKEEIRDGLKLTDQSEPKEAYFELLDEKEIGYLESDDKLVDYAVLAVLFGIFTIIAFAYFKSEDVRGGKRL